MDTAAKGRKAPRRETTEEYICRCFLDLVETKPFHTIRVREIVEYAGISRSSFYTHFGSIFDIVQRLEDDFLRGFYPSDAAASILVHGDVAGSIEQSEYLKENARVLKLLCGPNGDASFSSRIVQAIKRICDEVWKKEGTTLSRIQRDMLGKYIAGGTLMLMLGVADQGSRISPREMLGINTRVMAANKELLATKR